MRLFGYYALHTVKNQIRKLFRTWIAIFLLAMFVGGFVIGIGAAILTNVAENAGYITPEESDEPAWDEEEPEEEESAPSSRLFGVELSRGDMVELIAGIIVLAVLVIDVLGADKNGGKIFQPADVNILFASPMKPQSVLMFRLATQMGVMLLASLYPLIQVPNLLSFGLGGWGALAVILAWFFTAAIGRLLQMLFYMLCASNPRAKARFRRGVYIVLALAALGYVYYRQRTGGDWLTAAVGYFNAPASRLVPFWGWIKAMPVYAMEGNLPGALLTAAGTLAGGAALAFFTWRMRVDFYEDAMARSEETAAMLERAKTSKTGVAFGVRKKERSEKLRRDAMRHGAGANVFFFRAMYNRFRFAHLGFLTKTTETYLVLAALAALLGRFVLETRSILPVALTLGVLVFFRALGNPLEQDVNMDLFLLVPEKTRVKLFWSLLGGEANCALDLLPAMIAGAAIAGANPFQALAWFVFILSIDFYSTNISAFINLSVPTRAGKTVKQIVQVLFCYFGLIPDVALVAVGLLFERLAVMAIVAAAVNVGIGFLFFAFLPLFLEPGRA